MSLSPGQIIDDKYRIVRLLGEGGMGAVYEGENLRIRRRVAIKVLHADTASNADVVRRFEREAQAAGTIGNDHILEVLDLGTLPGGARYMVMEFLDGEPLSSRLKARGRLPPRELAPLIGQVLSGLAAAHQAGIVHRDLKPDNIYILREKAGHRDYVKIIDFGISKFSQVGGDSHSMTRTGTVMGTPYYMSPEQASGRGEADARSDLYAIGVLMYEAVTGQVPFDGNTFNELLFKIVLSEVKPLQEIVPDIDPAFASIVGKAMERSVEQRFQSAHEFLSALEDWVQRGTAVSTHSLTRGSSPFLPSGTSPSRGAAQPMSPPIPPSVPGGDKALSSQPRTDGSWVASHSQPVVPRKRSPVALLAGAGLVALVGVAAGAYKLLAKDPLASAPSAAAALQSAAPASLAPERAAGTITPVPEPAPKVEEPAPQPEGAAPQAVASTTPAAKKGGPAPPKVVAPPAKAAKGPATGPAKPAPKGPAQADLGY